MLENERSLQLFERELRVFERVNHPSIVRLHEVVFTADIIYLIMEYCPGGDLLHEVASHGRLFEARAKKIFLQVAQAVEYIHARGICHRDLKPENVLLCKSGDAKLCDFGLCRIQTGDSLLMTPCGSLSYTAPEICESDQYDGRKADIWSLGILLFVVTAGRRPWSGANHIEQVAAIKDHDPSFPLSFSRPLQEAIIKMLERDPEKRTDIKGVLASDWLAGTRRGISGARTTGDTIDLIRRWPSLVQSATFRRSAIVETKRTKAPNPGRLEFPKRSRIWYPLILPSK
jgi:5'-AMP-activated protein kinase catalytic alpha subunit